MGYLWGYCFNEAAANSPRKYDYQNLRSDHHRRFNEAAANSPRKSVARVFWNNGSTPLQ